MNKNLILGTVQFGVYYGINNKAGKPDTNSVFDILETAWDNGVDTLDTADAYGDAINLISSFHASSGKIFKINSKFKNLRTEFLVDKLRLDIAHLGCNKINIIFFHSYAEYKENKHFLDDLLRAKDDELVEFLGVSIYTNEELKAVTDDPSIDVIQLPFNLLDNDFQRGSLLALAKKKGKIIQVRSVFLQGLFFMGSDKLPHKVSTLKPWIQKIEEIGAQEELSIEMLCLLYPSSQAYIDEIIIGVDTKVQLLRNLGVFRAALPSTVKEKINQIAVTPSSILYPTNWI
ncbi:MAG: aldo/keto reductase [Chitinophagaceae bacterium]|nr:aldo/keto reductase [Chitinophagaceae bacterium]